MLINYWSIPNIDGAIYAEGNGVIMTKDKNADPLGKVKVLQKLQDKSGKM